MQTKLGIFLAAVLIMGVLSYPVPINNAFAENDDCDEQIDEIYHKYDQRWNDLDAEKEHTLDALEEEFDEKFDVLVAEFEGIDWTDELEEEYNEKYDEIDALYEEQIEIVEKVFEEKFDDLILEEEEELHALEEECEDESEHDEMEGDEMEWDEMEHDEMEGDEMEWDEMEHDEMEGDEMEWDEMEHDEMEGDEMEWDEMEHDKIWICHFPEGTDDILVKISVDESALEAHLNHGDFMGECGESDEFEHEKEYDDDFDDVDYEYEIGNVEHDVPDEISDLVDRMSDKFTHEEFWDIIDDNSLKRAASIIASETDLSYSEALELIEFSKEMKEKESDEKYMESDVTICHFPTDVDEMPETITISEFALEPHIKHGDIMEECEVFVDFDDFEVEEIEEDDNVIDDMMEGDFPMDSFFDLIFGGVTEGGNMFGDWFGGGSDEDIEEFEEEFDDYEFEDVEFEDDLSDELAEMEQKLEEKEMMLEEAEDRIKELEERLSQLEERYNLLQELLTE